MRRKEHEQLKENDENPFASSSGDLMAGLMFIFVLLLSAMMLQVQNRGEEVADYWSAIVIDDVIKNVDDAVRIRVYKNGEATTYAKVSAKGTLDVAADKNFLEEDYVMEDHVENFKPGDIDRFDK